MAQSSLFCLVRLSDRSIQVGPASALRLLGYRNGNVAQYSDADVKAVCANANGDLSGMACWPVDAEPSLASYQIRTNRTYAVHASQERITVSVTDVDMDADTFRADKMDAALAQMKRLLEPTDYLALWQAEAVDYFMPDITINTRAAIRARYQEIVTNLDGASTAAEVAAVDISFPG